MTEEGRASGTSTGEAGGAGAPGGGRQAAFTPEVTGARSAAREVAGPIPADPNADPNAAGSGGTLPEDAAAPAPTPAAETPAGGAEPEPDLTAGRTRISAVWAAVIGAAVIGVLLLVFILQNLRSVRITYFTFTGSFPLGAALLLAAVGGLLFAGVLATLRILQLRRRLRRARRWRR